ncbi:MAG: hypothetical protein JRI25_08125 [Deltaproteobacteria bacterium]|nr:hypothetical protein [Deltaproteobacteria bacterium]MBW2254551.1 hypothetical protein [Deltaproteobacteria bacterium]
MAAHAAWIMAITTFLTACIPAIPPAAGAGGAPPGARLVRARCNACHRPPTPDRLSPGDWEPFLAGHYVDLDEGEREDILQWMSTPQALGDD